MGLKETLEVLKEVYLKQTNTDTKQISAKFKMKFNLELTLFPFYFKVKFN